MRALAALTLAVLCAGCGQSQYAQRLCAPLRSDARSYIECIQRQQAIDAQSAAAAAAGLAGSAALIDASRPQPIAPLMAPAFPVQTQCIRNGRYVNCTSY